MSDDDFTKRMEDLRAKQQARYELRRLLPLIEQSELIAIRKKVRDLFGARGDIHTTPQDNGRLNVGFFHDDNKKIPPWRRKSTIVARGHTYREIVEQMELWKAKQT